MKVQSPTVSADLVFDEDKGGNRCVAAEAEGGCKGADKDDKNACCKETSGQFCHEGAKTKGFFCGRAATNVSKKLLTVVVPNKTRTT